MKIPHDVVTACYGRDLSSTYKADIEKFKSAYKALKISVTPKVHAVMFHIEEFCETKRMGLGPWSEQCTESFNHDFNTTWENFKIKNKEHKDYGNRLLQAVCMYNSQHL